jgi:hypothetical protein
MIEIEFRPTREDYREVAHEVAEYCMNYVDAHFEEDNVPEILQQLSYTDNVLSAMEIDERVYDMTPKGIFNELTNRLYL